MDLHGNGGVHPTAGHTGSQNDSTGEQSPKCTQHYQFVIDMTSMAATTHNKGDGNESEKLDAVARRSEDTPLRRSPQACRPCGNSGSALLKLTW